MAGSWKVGANIRQIVVFRRGDDWRLLATMINLEAPLLGKQPCPKGEIWIDDSDVIIVPKGPILLADDFINLVFTRGIYGVFPLFVNFDFAKVRPRCRGLMHGAKRWIMAGEGEGMKGEGGINTYPISPCPAVPHPAVPSPLSAVPCPLSTSHYMENWLSYLIPVLLFAAALVLIYWHRRVWLAAQLIESSARRV